MKFLDNGYFYIQASYAELLCWEAEGNILMAVLVDRTWVDIGKPCEELEHGLVKGEK